LRLIADLRVAGFTSILVVDDGSAPGCAAIFDAIEATASCHLLRHAVNLGKGRAIKTGLNYLLVHYPEIRGVVTCDADGQHLVADVVKVARVLQNSPDSLVLGVRSFDTDVPMRSKLGNVITRGIFYFLVGKYLSDTQTGLRGIPAAFMPTAMRLEGEGYEYEMNMLIAAKKYGLPFIEESIDTVYLENNRSSHFDPLLDSMKIYFLLVRFSCSSLLSSMLDIVLFTICFKLSANILISIFLGRYTIGPLVNFFVNRKFVFHHKDHMSSSLIRYYLFATAMGAAAYLLITAVTEQFAFSVIAAKILVEMFLFIISFTVQRDYIFARRTATGAMVARSEKGA
jgi:putative flippase GtrA